MNIEVNSEIPKGDVARKIGGGMSPSLEGRSIFLALCEQWVGMMVGNTGD